MAFQFTGFHHSGSGPWNKSLPFIIQCLFSHISNLDSVWFISVFASFLLSWFLCGCLEPKLRNTRSSGSWRFFLFFFFFHTLSHSLPLCVSASLYSAVKTPQPPSHGCHSNHLPALTSYVSVRAFVYVSAGKSACALRDVTYWKSVRWLLVLPPWGFSLIRGCLCFTKLHTHTQPHTYAHTQAHVRAHTLTLERLPVYLNLMCCNCGSWVWLWIFQF